MRIIHNEQFSGRWEGGPGYSCFSFFCLWAGGNWCSELCGSVKNVKEFLGQRGPHKVPGRGREEHAGKHSLFSALENSISQPADCSQEGVSMGQNPLGSCFALQLAQGEVAKRLG